MTNKEAICNYANSLPINHNPNVNLQEVISLCLKPAFNDATLNSAGNVWKIRDYVDEVVEAKAFLTEQLMLYFNSLPVKTPVDFDTLHKQICDKLILCFPNYNAEREKTGIGRNVGFTYGNAQKFVNMAFKNIYAILTIYPNIMPNFDKYFTFCHMPFDSYIYAFIKKQVNSKIVALKTPWSKQTDYEEYISAQYEVRDFIKNSADYVGLTTLEAEFQIWENSKPKNQIGYTVKQKNQNGKQSKNIEMGELGESLVLTELINRGYTAKRTIHNAADIDIIAENSSGVKINVQVKAKSPTNNTDEWSLGSGNRAQSLINQDVWFIFVDLSSEPKDFYIEHCSTVLKKAIHRKKVWDNGFNRKTGLPHKPDPRLFFRGRELIDENGVKKKNNWQDLP